MKSIKTKIFITMASLCLVAVIAVVAVWAASQASTTITFTISYTASAQVKAEITQEYQINKGGDNDLTEGDVETIGSTLSFLGTEKANNTDNKKTASVGDSIVLEYHDEKQAADYVVFTITVKNNGTSGLYVTPTATGSEGTNLIIAITYSITNLTKVTNQSATSGTKITTAIETSKTMTLEIKYSVTNIYESANVDKGTLGLELSVT